MPRLGTRRMRRRHRGQIDARRFHGGNLRTTNKRRVTDPRGNPQLMIVNPHMTKGDAEKAFRKFHHVKATKAKKVNLPEGFPKYITQLGFLDKMILASGIHPSATAFTLRPHRGRKIFVATDPAMNTLYIGPVRRDEIQMIERSGYYVPERINYTTPVKSKGVGRRWYHDFDDPPYVEVVEDWLVLSGPSLQITDRGIEG